MLNDIPSLGAYYAKTGTGQAAMTMFFVLSGFLIFYLLLNEKTKTGTIAIKSFYKKRIARIWPVYYIFVLAGILWFSHDQSFSSPAHTITTSDNYIVVFLYLFHLPNFHLFFGGSLLALGHLWSLGVEEQFYLLCPLIIKKTKNYLKLFLVIIILKVSIKIFVAYCYHFLSLTPETIVFLGKLGTFLFKLRFEAFAIGGIAAYLFIEKKDAILNYLYQPKIQWLNILVLLVTLPFGNKSESLHVLFAVNFAIIIINMTGNGKPLFILDNKYSNYIGQISYGIYVYQIPIIFFLANVFKSYYSSSNIILWNVSYYLVCIFFPIITAVISYELMERKVIKWARDK